MGQLRKDSKNYIADHKQKNDQTSPVVPKLVRCDGIGTCHNGSKTDNSLLVATQLENLGKACKNYILHWEAEELPVVPIVIRHNQKANSSSAATWAGHLGKDLQEVHIRS